MANEKLILGPDRDSMHMDIVRQVRLNRYDLRFMHNIYQKYITVGKPLSPGQNDLYEKIIHKYRKQLKKLGVRYKDIVSLTWRRGILPIEILDKQTYFKILSTEQNKTEMQLYFNFNKDQIEEVRTIVHDDKCAHLKLGMNEHAFGNGQKYNFIWDKDEKTWTGEFNLYLFKGLYEFVKKHNICIDESVQTVVDALDKSGTEREWTPHVHISNGRIYINMITETMLPELENIDMTDLSIWNIEKLSVLGLSAPDEFAHISEFINSISPDTRHEICDEDDASVLKRYIKESGRKAIFYSNTWERRGPQSTITDSVVEWDASVRRVDINDSVTSDDVDKFLKEGYNTLITTIPVSGLFRQQSAIGKFALEANKIIYITIVGKRDNSNHTNKR